MSNISGMDRNNTPFLVPAKMASGVDGDSSIRNPFSTNRRNIDVAVRRINTNAKELNKSLSNLEAKVEIIHADDDTGLFILDTENIDEIRQLVNNMRIALDNLLEPLD
jgi:hypothetical protein